MINYFLGVSKVKKYKRDYHRDLAKRFAYFYKFCDGNVNKFILLLKKQYSWKTFDETFLPDKETFYCSWNMEDITDIDYSYAKRVFKYLINNNLQSFTKYSRLTLVLMWNSTLREIFNFGFSNFYFGRKTGH